MNIDDGDHEDLYKKAADNLLSDFQKAIALIENFPCPDGSDMESVKKDCKHIEAIVRAGSSIANKGQVIVYENAILFFKSVPRRLKVFYGKLAAHELYKYCKNSPDPSHASG